MGKPQIISLEGMVGSGKTTQIQLLDTHLSPDCYLIPELNQFSPMIQAIERWKIRLQERNKTYGFEREDIIDLSQARAETQKKLLGKIRNHKYVLMDRSIYTSMVFEYDPVSMEEIKQINLDKGVIVPHQCIVLECPIKEALKRVDERRIYVGKYSHRAPHETKEFITRTRNLYRELARENDSIFLINSSYNPQQVFLNILEVLEL